MRFVAAAVIAALLATTAVAQDTRSPADLYGPLFEQVQTQKIFKDGKTFVDAAPKAPTAEILAAYGAQTPRTPEALRAFVERWFDVPSEAPAPAPDTARPPLRQHISDLWPHLSRPPLKTARGSALPLDHPYVVPGGRFREIYYWDSYFTLLGLVADGRGDLARGLVDNFSDLIRRHGRIPNGTRTYYLSRSQPPFFALMAEAVAPDDPDILSALRAEHAFWMDTSRCETGFAACRRVVRMPDGALLNRYWDDRDTPRDESFAEDVETARQTPRARSEVYRHLRAGAESSWDYSSRWLADGRTLSTIHTTDIVPVDLNSLLWYLEREIARRCGAAGRRTPTLDFATCEVEFNARAEIRRLSLNAYLWSEDERRFGDYDYTTRQMTPSVSAAALYPLFVKLATPEQAEATAAMTRGLLLAEGGLRTTTVETGQQWDRPNGWAPLQWVAVQGLENYGERDLAHDIARRFVGTVAAAYAETGKMLEKYDVEARRPGGGGEYPLQDGFGWTNGVTRALIGRYPDIEPK